jgi:hypothetical protein
MKLRYGNKDTGNTVVATKKFYPKKVQGWKYPTQTRDAGHTRIAMTGKDTLRYIARDPGNSARMLEFSLKFKGKSSKGPARGLKSLGLSRNHIVADSQVAAILRKGLDNGSGVLEKVRREPAHFLNFVRTLAGSNADAAEVLFVRDLQRTSGASSELVNMVSNGDGNVRIGDATRNEGILSGFDEETDWAGRPTQRSANARSALQGLWRYTSALDVMDQPDQAWSELIAGAGARTYAPQDFNSKRYSIVSSSSVSRLDQQDPESFRPRGVMEKPPAAVDDAMMGMRSKRPMQQP